MKQTVVVALLIPLLWCGCAHIAGYTVAPEGTQPEDLAVVSIPPEIEVRSINGKAAPGPKIWTAAKGIEWRVATGPQKWEVRYYDPFLDDEQSIDRFSVDRSSFMPLAFTAEKGKSYRIRFATPREDPSLQYTKQQVRIWAEDQQTQAAVSQPVDRSKKTKRPPLPSPASTPEPLSPEKTALDQLKTWWPIAGKQEREEFLKWIDAAEE